MFLNEEEEKDYRRMSLQEQKVKQFLDEKQIINVYEPPVSVVEEGGKIRTWYPDFYLPQITCYVEVCGAYRPDIYGYRSKVFDANNIPILFLKTYLDGWQEVILEYINELQAQRTTMLIQILRNCEYLVEENQPEEQQPEPKEQREKAYCVADIQKTHPRAYERWTEEEETQLTEYVGRGYEIDEITSLMGRQPSAIRCRLRKMGF